MADLKEFLSALFAGCPDNAIILSTDAADFAVTTGDEIDMLAAKADGEAIYVSPRSGDHLAFMHAVTENVADPSEWQDWTLKPTAVLSKEGTLIAVYALDQAVLIDASVTVLYTAMGGDVEDQIPTPGANGWALIHCDPDTYQTLDAISDTYLETPDAPERVASAPAADAPPWDEPLADLGTLEDAVILAPLDLTEPQFQQELVISVGANFKSTKWRNDRMPVGRLISILAKHPEGKTKDGPGFVLAEIIGDNRKKQAVAHCYGIGLDIDVGMPGEDIDRVLLGLGCAAVRYTTFSHGKTSSKLNKDKIVKWCDQEGIDFDGEAVLRFLREKTKWHESLLATAEYTGDEHDATGLMACVSHGPIQKHRVVLPLATPFDPTKVAKTHAQGMALWAEVCRATARLLGDLPMDNAATDPSRLFYFPRHMKGRPHESTVFGGPLFDWNTLDLDGETPPEVEGDDFDKALAAEVASDEKKQKPKSRSKTDEGKKLGRWAVKRAHGFQIADVIRDHADDRIRTHGSTKLDVECPFDDDHSNPGDPEDRGCFVCNAGDGPSDIFTIKCAHDSCQGRTNLDFLGKMLKDQWFGEDVLVDENYNAAAPEEAPNPEAAMKVAAEDDAREEYEKLIDTLTPNSTDADVEEAISSFLSAGLKGRTLLTAEQTIKSNLKLTQANYTRLIKSVRTELSKNADKVTYKDPKGRMVFAFQGEFNFDEGYEACFKALLQTNRKDQEPTFCCVQDQPVRLTRHPLTGRIAFEELDKLDLWSELNKRVTFVRQSDQGDGTRQAVPRDVADHVYAQAYAELPQSPEIIYTPLFTADGSLVVTPGYKHELNLIMANTKFHVDVPENPTAADVEEAVRFLKEEVLVDFPFLDYDLQGVERREPSEANAIAMLITPFMRRMIKGCTPVFFVAKPVAGTGGTLLGKLPMLIFDGVESAPMRYSQNEEEMQKALLAAIIETRSHLFFDDVKEFNNRSLLQSITAQEIGGRLLGLSRNVSRPNIFNWIGTGNNPHVGSEMERRICWIRMNARVANIQDRVYHHDDFPGFIVENRSLIVSHILTLIQYWIDTGCQTFEERKRASFEDWSRKVGGVLQAAGIDGFLDNRRSAGADMDETAIAQFVKEWLKKFTFDRVMPSKLFEHALALEMDIIEGNNDDQKKQRFPKRLHSLEGRVFEINKTLYQVASALDDDNNLVYALTLIEPAAEEQVAA
jgi:hypothetical protein